MDLDEEFKTVIDPAINSAMGKQATYIVNGGLPKAVIVFVDLDVERIGGEGITVERQTEIDVLRVDIDKPGRGDKIIVGSVSYIVDGIVSDDGSRVVLKVRC